jgi:mycothiol synthase
MPPCSVSLAAPHELLPALRLLFGRRPDHDGGPERYRDAIAADAHVPTAVFVTRDDAGRVVGAALVQALPGALGVAWPPRAPTPEAEDAVTRAASDWLRERGVKVCQAFAPADELPDMTPLTRNGFAHVTQLAFMRRELTAEPPAEPTNAIRFVSAEAPGDAAFAMRFAATLLATYEGTRDCPELNGTRTAADLALEVESAGEHFLAYDPSRPDTPVGVVSLTGGAESGLVELTYLGVVPSERGRGYGRALLAFAAAEAARSRAAALVLNVDARNEPALRLYRRHGFVETERREVFLAHYPVEPGASAPVGSAGPDTPAG